MIANIANSYDQTESDICKNQTRDTLESGPGSSAGISDTQRYPE